MHTRPPLLRSAKTSTTVIVDVWRVERLGWRQRFWIPAGVGPGGLCCSVGVGGFVYFPSALAGLYLKETIMIKPIDDEPEEDELPDGRHFYTPRHGGDIQACVCKNDGSKGLDVLFFEGDNRVYATLHFLPGDEPFMSAMDANGKTTAIVQFQRDGTVVVSRIKDGEIKGKRIIPPLQQG